MSPGACLGYLCDVAPHTPWGTLRAEIMRPQVHVWLARPDDPGHDARLEGYRGLLTDEERARGERFRFARHRRQFWVTRALVRTSLSQYFDVPPRDWRFEPDVHGRPRVVSPCEVSPLSFNLSHTDGLIACGCTWGATLGCDVEDLQRRLETHKVARRFFAEPEVAALDAGPQDLRPRRFLEFWTLKEAYLKARGTGLRLPLGDFAFELSERIGGLDHALPERIRIAFHGIDDDPARWRFTLHDPTPHHLLALALNTPIPIPIHLHHWTGD